MGFQTHKTMPTTFFATRHEITALLKHIEQKENISYCRKGHHESPKIPVVRSHNELSEIFTNPYGLTLADGYLMKLPGNSFSSRPIILETGAIRSHYVDTSNNQPCIRLNIGGLFEEHILIAYEVANVGWDVVAEKLYRRVRYRITKDFLYHRQYGHFVGQEAAELLRSGYRLTINARNTLMDLRADLLP